MNRKHTLLFCISLLCAFSSLNAQQTETANDEAITVTDTLQQKTKYGLRVGLDLSKPIRSLLDNRYSGFEVVGDFRFSDRFYAAAEIGNETKDTFEPNLNFSTSGSYAKIGADYNAYNNWFGLNNAITAGLRYGFSTFKQELLAYRVYTTLDASFPNAVNTEPKEYTGLTAHWAEFILGIKTEVLNNVYVSVTLQLKQKISEDTPENFDNLYIPGFHRVNDFSEFGVGFGYTVSYLIPIFRK